MFLRFIFCLLLGFLLMDSFAQDTTWISRQKQIIPSRDSAVNYNVSFRNPEDSNRVKILLYTITDSLLIEVNLLSDKRDGIFRKYKLSKLYDERVYKEGVLHGYQKTFWEDGSLRRHDIYENGDWIEGKCYTRTGKDTSWFPFEVKASFPGGLSGLSKFLLKQLNPDLYNPDNSNNEVSVEFDITEEGKLENIRIKKNAFPELEREAIRIVKKMPKWLPAQVEGIPIKSHYVLPIIYDKR